MRRGTLIVMVKEPVAGRVKTRLGRDIGMVAAAWWFRHQTRRLLRSLEDPRWTLVLAVSPDTALVSRFWPGHLARMPQGRGDLGVRMARAIDGIPGPVLLIGGDIPGVTRAHIAGAFRALGSAASVVGPASDGGFWLIGLRNGTRRYPGLFHGVTWSSPTTLVETLPTRPAPVAIAATLGDIDTAADLAQVNPG